MSLSEIFRLRIISIQGIMVNDMVASKVVQMMLYQLHLLQTDFWMPYGFHRYVDDSHVGISKIYVDEFHTHLNSIDPNIQFTVETEEEGAISFLDTKTTRQDDGSILVSVYRKPTHTDRYLDFNSHHHMQHKRSVAKTLLGRARNIPSSPRDKSSETKHVFDALGANSYPVNFLKSCKTPGPQQRTQPQQPQQPEQDRGFVVLPYIKDVSEKITRTLNKFNVRVSHKSTHTISSILKKPKDRIDKSSTTGVVYRINCKE
ncbi:hypothetical protein QZH41_003871 [Actinostola sp. cb2023]|nr:hypothetical protein QZH41_003871 [Actinostola sp. cb2023]